MTPAERIAKHGSALDAYHLQDGIWLPHAPVLVNEDFDFALAMSMEDGLGAGLAAAARQQNNQKRADELRELRFDDALNARIEELRCCGRDVYFVLWGKEGALKMVVDESANEGRPGSVVDGTSVAKNIAAPVAAVLAGVECGR
jgi:hypothetical protein